MHRDVEEYVHKCHTCQRNKPCHEFKAPMGVVSEPATTFEVTAMDICGPFPRTASGNRYLLTFVDHLTNYPEAVPIKQMTVEEFARAYGTQIIARQGSGSKLITDQGRNFTTEFFWETRKILGIRQIFTTAYHPPANGILERRHKTLSESISHYVNANGNNWDKLFPFFLMAFRNRPYGTSKYSPFYMLHGREMVPPSLKHLKAKLSSGIRHNHQAPRLENLKANLRPVTNSREKMPENRTRLTRCIMTERPEKVSLWATMCICTALQIKWVYHPNLESLGRVLGCNGP